MSLVSDHNGRPVDERVLVEAGGNPVVQRGMALVPPLRLVVLRVAPEHARVRMDRQLAELPIAASAAGLRSVEASRVALEGLTQRAAASLVL